MEELKNAYRILVGCFLENSLLKVSEGLGKTTLRWILGRYVVKMEYRCEVS
jgi:hypothetical protein